jgi:type IX secretion system PorP/SprF family membrane protein
MMKRYSVYLLVLLLFTISGYAQQKPQYTQYIFNNFLLNPALSGMENYTDVRIGYRQQWQGIADAPKTSFVSAHMALGDKYLWKNALSLPENGNPPMSRNYTQNYTASPAHHGIGLVGVIDKAGPISNMNIDFTYAYHLKLQNAMNLSVGTSIGINRVALDINAITLEDENDPALANTVVTQYKPDVGLGLWLYGARFFLGASMQQIIPQKLEFTSDNSYTTGKQVPHLFITTGYKLFVADDISATPSIMIKRVEAAPVSVDLNLKLSFADRFWLGGSYRRSDSFSAFAGLNINNFINLTYAYDLTISELRSYTSGSHEIVLGFQLNNIYHVPSSMRMW